MLLSPPMLYLIFTAFISLSSANAADHERYSRLYPQHVEYCAGTRFKVIDGIAGGNGGHGFTYVHGLCKDRAKNYPQVKVCDGTDDHTGVGISANSDFHNVNWVAVPNYSLVIDGNLRKGEKVTPEIVQRAATDAIRERIFENVRLNKPELTRDPVTGRQLVFGTEAYTRAAAINSEGTDLAVRFARNLECVRVPIQKQSLPKIAKHLNNLNNSYYLTGKPYVWEMLQNNCAHVATEILEMAGIRKAIPKEQPKYEQIFNMGLPRNGIYTLMQIGQLRSTGAWDVYHREADRKKIESNSPWMPTQVGVLAKRYPGFKNNSVFDISDTVRWIPPTDLDGFLTAREAFEGKGIRTFSDIDANLAAWEVRYMSELDSAEKSSSLDVLMKSYAEFKDSYARYLRGQIDRIRELRKVD